jgi:nucleotide-binding universal stress UspA family protein
MKQSVLVPTDLTDVASKAIDQAAVIAKKGNFNVTLLHVLSEKSPASGEVEKQLKTEALRVKELTGEKCEILLREGSVFEVTDQLTSDQSFNLIVIGTHGIHGIRQHFMGPDILKLANKVTIPLLVVQKDSPLIEKFQTVIMPVSSHKHFSKEIESILLFTTLFDTEVHLYSIQKPGYDWPEQLRKNIGDALATFELKGVRIKRVKEEQTVLSQGYAKQTLLYAESSHADFISMISAPSDEYYYFADADKEALLLNELRLPVLCTP